MSNQEFETKRTALANAFAAAGADLLDYIGIADTAVAAIPDTQPQKYAAAGTLNGILSMAGKMMGEDGVTGLKLLPHYAIDRHGNGDVQNYFRVADVERLLAAAAVGEGVPDLHNAIKAAFIAGFKESGEGWNYEMLCDPENDPHFVARMNDYLAAAAVSQPTGDLTDEQIKNVAHEAVWDRALSWTGFEKDERGFYTVPSLSKCHYQFARAIARAAIAAHLARQPKAEQPLWDDNGEPWNDAAEQADRAAHLARQAQAEPAAKVIINDGNGTATIMLAPGADLKFGTSLYLATVSPAGAQNAEAIRNQAADTTRSEDTELLDFVEGECVTVQCYSIPYMDDADVGFKVIQYHMAEPREREIGFGSTPRAALRDAIRNLQTGSANTQEGGEA